MKYSSLILVLLLAGCGLDLGGNEREIEIADTVHLKPVDTINSERNNFNSLIKDTFSNIYNNNIYKFKIYIPYLNYFMRCNIVSNKNYTKFRYHAEPATYYVKYDSTKSQFWVYGKPNSNLLLKQEKACFFNKVTALLKDFDIKKEKSLPPLTSESVIFGMKIYGEATLTYDKRFLIDNNATKYSPAFMALSDFVIEYTDSIRLDFENKAIAHLRDSVLSLE